MDEIEWHQQVAILAIDGYVEVEFSENFRKHWYSVAYKGSECNDDFKRFAVGFVDDYLEMLNRLKGMVEALPGGAGPHDHRERRGRRGDTECGSCIRRFSLLP